MDKLTIMFVLAGLAIVILIAGILISNFVKRTYMKVEESRAGVEVALSHRFDRITQLAKVCKAHMNAELQFLVEAIKLRQGPSVTQMQELTDKLNQAVSQLRVTAEAYPELSPVLYGQLMEAINETEINLSSALRLFNSNAAYFNSKRIEFPTSIFAKKYPAYELFHVETQKREIHALDI